MDESRKPATMRPNKLEFDFRSELSAVMYGFGDKKEQLAESLDLMNEIVVEYMQGMTREAMKNSFGGSLSTESLLFSIRKDSRKVDRVKQLLVMYGKVVEERDLHLKDEAKALAQNAEKEGEAGKNGKTPKKTGGKKPPAKRKAAGKSDKGGTNKAAKTSKGGTQKSAPQPKSKVSQSVEQLLADPSTLATLTSNVGTK